MQEKGLMPSIQTVFLGLVHRGCCQGMVAPALSETITETELRDLVSNAVCMRCGEPVSDAELEAEYD